MRKTIGASGSTENTSAGRFFSGEPARIKARKREGRRGDPAWAGGGNTEKRISGVGTIEKKRIGVELGTAVRSLRPGLWVICAEAFQGATDRLI